MTGRLIPMLVLCAALGCSTDDAPPPAEDTSGPDTDSMAPSDAPTPARNEACGDFDDGTYGEKVPWTGFEHEGTTYTCNACRGGLPEFQGTWRLLDFDTEDPEEPLTDGWTQTFTFDGNLWQQRATWQSGGATEQASMEGWYWCGSKPEVNNEAKVFVVADLSPSDAFGYTAGYVFTADLLSSADGGDRLAFLFYDGFNTGDQPAEVYCRVGSTVTTQALEEKACTDPFE